MKIFKFIYPLLALLAVTACEAEIDFPVKPDQSRIYLECFPSPGTDITYIMVQSAVPVHDYNRSTELKNLDLDFKVNSISQKAGLVSTQENILYYGVRGSWTSGDEISITASAEGHPVATASSIIPEAPEYQMSRNLDGGSLNHVFTFKRDPSAHGKCYYGVSIKGITAREKRIFATGEKEILSEKEQEIKYVGLHSSVESDDDLMGIETITEARANGIEMIVCEDDGVSEELKVTISILHWEDRPDEWNQKFEIMRKSRYQLSVYKLNKAAYEYLNPQVNYPLLGAGLVSPFASLGNIKDGYGILDCMGKVETPWLENLK